MADNARNVIPNADFSEGTVGDLPASWQMRSPTCGRAPVFGLEQKDGTQVLMVRGSGDENGVGCLYSTVRLTAGKTYRMYAQFDTSEDIDPYRHMLFAFYTEGFNNGIFRFTSSGGHFEGENRFLVPGNGEIKGEIQIYFRLNAGGKAWIRQVGLEECTAVAPRRVKVAAVQGTASLGQWEQALDYIGGQRADLVLLPETFRSTDYNEFEPIDGPSASLMAKKAKQYGMYVAGTFYHKDGADACLYNTGLVMDRNGEVIGRYDKNHPFSPELLDGGVTPGTGVPVFDTDFGKIGMMICYDSWFTDVAELLALRGAEIILFPNAGYYQSIIPARAADNCVRILASSLSSPLGIWDTTGAEVQNPDADPTRHARNDATFSDVYRAEAAGIKILFATLDLNEAPSPHNWGGPMRSAPGGRRNRREQKALLHKEIQNELESRI